MRHEMTEPQGFFKERRPLTTTATTTTTTTTTRFAAFGDQFLVQKFIAQSMVMLIDSVVFKLLELYRRANRTCQGKE